MQFGNLFATRTRKLSLFQQSPFENKHLFAAIFFSSAAAVLVVYVPFFQEVFQTFPISAEYWFIPIAFAILLVILDELRKLAIRTYPDSLLAKIAW